MNHILFYTDTPNVGGAEKHMLLLATKLKEKGVRVSLAYGKYSGLSKMHSDFAKVCEKVYVLNVLHKHDPRHYSELKKLLAKASFDLIHLHVWNPGSCRYAFYAASSVKLPIVTTEHDPFELKGIKKTIKNDCLKKTSQVITVSSINHRLLQEYYDVPSNKLSMVSNGIDYKKFTDCQESASLPSNKGDQVITCIAELHDRKGHKYLLEAFKKLQAQMPTVQLMLVGKGPAERKLKDQYGNIPNVNFLGWRDDIPQILKASDILVLPSLKEAFGLVILEAMASSVIPIATNNGGTTDIIQDGITGYLVSPGSSDALYQKLATLLKNPAQRKDMEKAALESVRKDFSAKAMTEKTLAIYKKIN